jgi:hypothetical protein
MKRKSMEIQLETLNNILPSIRHLFSWSQNYDFPSPFSVFLDLTGYSQEEFGESLVKDPSAVLGYLEMGMLGRALDEYATDPGRCEDYVRFLLFCECEQLDWDDESNEEVQQALQDMCPWYDIPELAMAA